MYIYGLDAYLCAYIEVMFTRLIMHSGIRDREQWLIFLPFSTLPIASSVGQEIVRALALH